MTPATNMCLLSEIELNTMADADARKLDAVADELPARGTALGFAAKKAACHLRAMREVRRQAATETIFWKRKLV